MSKPESTGAKSLEEILASIRKSLADEAGGRLPEPRPAPARAAQPLPQPQPQPKPAAPTPAPARTTNVPAKGVGPLAAKLAGAVNGAAGGPSLDADLSELLASDPKKPTLSMPDDAGKPSTESDGDSKDPLWFLTRLSAAAAGPPAAGAAPTGPAARARDAAKATQAPKVEEVKLSRPETLRPSLPPLFDTKAESAPGSSPAPSEKPADVVSKTERTQPQVLRPPAEDAVTGKDAAEDAAGDGLPRWSRQSLRREDIAGGHPLVAASFAGRRQRPRRSTGRAQARNCS